MNLIIQEPPDRRSAAMKWKAGGDFARFYLLKDSTIAQGEYLGVAKVL
jgi:hypothetical protein